MVVAAATPQGYYGNSGSAYSSGSSGNAYSGSASAGSAGVGNLMDAFSMSGLVNMGWQGLSAAEGSLDDLMAQWPAVLNMIPDSIKSDIVKVNGIIAEACAKMVSDAQPGDGFNYYSAGGMKSTCDSINSMAKGVSDAISDPAWTQYYVDQLKGQSKSLKSTVGSLGY